MQRQRSMPWPVSPAGTSRCGEGDGVAKTKTLAGSRCIPRQEAGAKGGVRERCNVACLVQSSMQGSKRPMFLELASRVDPTVHGLRATEDPEYDRFWTIERMGGPSALINRKYTLVALNDYSA